MTSILFLAVRFGLNYFPFSDLSSEQRQRKSVFSRKIDDKVIYWHLSGQTHGTQQDPDAGIQIYQENIQIQGFTTRKQPLK